MSNLEDGSCAIVCLFPDEGENISNVFFANLGDSRAVLYRSNGTFMRMTTDHKPKDPKEKKMIERGGGVVELWEDGQYRVSASTDANNMLAVSRSIGDIEWKVPNLVLSPVPEVTSYILQSKDRWIVLASDALWDHVTEKQVFVVSVS